VEPGWDAVTLDIGGSAESVDHYNVYRGESPDFVPDKTGGSNLIGSAPTELFRDTDAVAGADYYYLVTAVDGDGNESNAIPSVITTPPVLSGSWSRAWIDVDWTDAAPLGSVVAYRVYYGLTSGQYDSVVDVGLNTSYRLFGTQQNVNYFIAVTVVDINGNESPFSNEHVDALAGTISIRVHDEEELCWGADTCTPTDPEKLQRNNGWQLLIPVDFPQGDWVSVIVKFTVDSRLCTPPAMGTTTKCGSGNPCVSPPCNGGYNPCGDPWDRGAHLFLVLDEACIETGGNCMTNNNLELIRSVTPFGTDAPPPDGTGVIDPMVYEMDITPYAPPLDRNQICGNGNRPLRPERLVGFRRFHLQREPRRHLAQATGRRDRNHRLERCTSHDKNGLDPERGRRGQDAAVHNRPRRLFVL